MEIQKIEKPETGWSENYLEDFGFYFESEKFKKQRKLFMLILDRDLPYFYYVKNEEYNDVYPYFIFIKEEFIESIKISSRKNYFDKNILKYIHNKYIIIKNEQEIFTIIDKLNQEAKERLEIQKKREEEYKKKQERYRQKKKENQYNTKQEDISYEEQKGGIYGIYSVDANQEYQLLYIGLTTRSFQERLQEHKDIIDGKEEIPKGMERLYNLLISESEKKHLEAKYLVSFSKMSANKYLSRSEKEAMEMAFIYYFHPPGNTAGITVPYKFSGI